MNTISMTNLPEKYWIYRNKKFYCSTPLPELPWVRAENEQILKENNIPYKKLTKTLYVDSDETMEVCEYWNPDLFEEENLTLPVYVLMPDVGYRYVSMHTIKVVTTDTIKEAVNTKKFVEEKLREHRQQLYTEKMYNWAKEQLSGGTARIVHSQEEIVPLRSSHCYNIEKNGDKFKILRIPLKNYSNYPTRWVAIFDMNTVPPNGIITLKIPKEVAGIVIGKSHSNLIAMANEIGVKKIIAIQPKDS